jgi:hypothetical protein
MTSMPSSEPTTTANPRRARREGRCDERPRPGRGRIDRATPGSFGLTPADTLCHVPTRNRNLPFTEPTPTWSVVPHRSIAGPNTTDPIRLPHHRFVAEMQSAPAGLAGSHRRALRGTHGTGPPPIERRALAFDSTNHIARRALRLGGRCPFSLHSPVSRRAERCHRSTLTRLPEPSVLVPIGTDLTEASWGGPRSFGSEPLPRRPRLPVSPVCLADPPGRPGVPAGRPSLTVAREPGLDPTPDAVACSRTPTPRCRRLPVGPV